MARYVIAKKRGGHGVGPTALETAKTLSGVTVLSEAKEGLRDMILAECEGGIADVRQKFGDTFHVEREIHHKVM